MTTNPYFTSKSGKKLSIQHGFCWYEEHDTTRYNILKVLVDSIPKGQPGHVSHYSALCTLHRVKRTARFGIVTQIAYQYKSGKGGVLEHTTYLLDKYQFLLIAAALNDEYLRLVVSTQYANLSAEELVIDFMRTIKKQLT